MEENLKIPNHVAIILDGNGRWAKAKGMPRNYGHVQGTKTVEVICEEAYRMGIQYLTVYAFSTENWNRPQDEVDALMKLLRNYMKTCLKTAEKIVCASEFWEIRPDWIRTFRPASRNWKKLRRTMTVCISRLPSTTVAGMRSSVR